MSNRSYCPCCNKNGKTIKAVVLDLIDLPRSPFLACHTCLMETKKVAVDVKDLVCRLRMLAIAQITANPDKCDANRYIAKHLHDDILMTFLTDLIRLPSDITKSAPRNES